MKRRTLLQFCSAFVLAGGAVFAGDARQTLADTREFAFGGVGVAGTTSAGELAFREVLKSPTAKADFAALTDGPNAPGRCYGLVGLRAVDPIAYRARIDRFRKDNTEVKTIAGCTIFTQPMSAVVVNIDAGRYDGYAKNPSPSRDGTTGRKGG